MKYFTRHVNSVYIVCRICSKRDFINRHHLHQDLSVQILFRQFYSVSCINEYMSIDSGESM